MTKPKQINCEILMIESHNNEQYEVVVAESLPNLFLRVSRMSIEELAGLVCNGTANLLGYNATRDGSLLEHYSGLMIDHIESILYAHKLLICRDRDAKTQDAVYLILDEDLVCQTISEEEAKTENFLNAFTDETGTMRYQIGNRPIANLPIYSSLFKASDEKKDFLNFTKQPYVKRGRVQLSSTLSRELTNCQLIPTMPASKISIPKYIQSIGHNGLTLTSGVYRQLHFNSAISLRPDSIACDVQDNAPVQISVLNMTSKQVADTKLAFLHTGHFKVSSLRISGEATEDDIRILADTLFQLYRYIDIDWLFDESQAPITQSIQPLGALSLIGRKVDGAQETVYECLKTILRGLARDLDLFLADLQISEAEPDERPELIEYAKRIIELNCSAITDKLVVFLQPFCMVDLLNDPSTEIQALVDTLHSDLLELIEIN